MQDTVDKKISFVPDIPVLLVTDDLLIINKPAGIPVHGNRSIATRLSGKLSILQQEGALSFKPGPLHRLDKNTTGILCFSRTLAGAQWFSYCLRAKTADKYYLGVVRGAMPARCIETGTETSKAVTHCYPLAYNKKINASFMLFRLVTGKKHQIRIHMQQASYPLAGDRRYGGGHPLPYCTCYLLHAWRLYFPEDRPADIPVYIEAPFFPEMDAFCKTFFPDWKKNAACLRMPV